MAKKKVRKLNKRQKKLVQKAFDPKKKKLSRAQSKAAAIKKASKPYKKTKKKGFLTRAQLLAVKEVKSKARRYVKKMKLSKKRKRSS